MARDLAGVSIEAGSTIASSSGPAAKRQKTSCSPAPLGNPPAPPVISSQGTQGTVGSRASYSETVAGRPLVVSSRVSGRSLGRPDLLKLEGRVQRGLLQSPPGFPVRNSGFSFSRGSIRINCLDQRSHDWMKTLINSSTDIGCLARSPEELPRLKKYGARVSSAVDVGSFIKLLCQCNPALDASKLHVRGTAQHPNGKTIIVGAEPEMATVIDQRGGKFCFLISEVVLRAFGGGLVNPRSSTPKATPHGVGSGGRKARTGPVPTVSPVTTSPGAAAGSGRTVATSGASRLPGPRQSQIKVSGAGCVGPSGPGGASTTPQRVSQSSQRPKKTDSVNWGSVPYHVK